MTARIAALLVSATLAIPVSLRAQETAWDSVSRVLGTPDDFAAGYHRYNLPRRDLTLRVGDVAVASTLGLGAWAGFSRTPDDATLMGDLVFTSSEVRPVLAELVRDGIEVTAVNNHLIGEVPIAGQKGPVPYQVTWKDAVSVGAAGVLYVLPGVLALPHGPPSCAPCDPAALPEVDRWAVRPVSATGDAASDVVLAGVAGFTAFEGLHGLPVQRWQGNFAVFANTASWTAASTAWLKVLVRRKRPVLYTTDAIRASSDPESQQSLPSLHASLAFAAATSYFVIAKRQRLPHRTRNALLLYAGAVGVAALRVAAGKHFPTDVLAGAALGSGIGWVVPTIHPTQP